MRIHITLIKSWIIFLNKLLRKPLKWIWFLDLLMFTLQCKTMFLWDVLKTLSIYVRFQSLKVKLNGSCRVDWSSYYLTGMMEQDQSIHPAELSASCRWIHTLVCRSEFAYSRISYCACFCVICSCVTVKRRVLMATQWTRGSWTPPYQPNTSISCEDRWFETSGNRWLWRLLKLYCGSPWVNIFSRTTPDCCVLLWWSTDLFLTLGGRVKLSWYGTWNFIQTCDWWFCCNPNEVSDLKHWFMVEVL